MRTVALQAIEKRMESEEKRINDEILLFFYK